MRCGIYVRISSDPRGEKLGVQRQEEDCRALAERKGWEVYDVYVDNDTSAYKGKKRPQWERLVADVRAGRIQAIVGWHVDRLTRKPRELEDLIDFAEQYGLQLGTVTGEIDLSTAVGQLLARQLGSLARYESQHRGERRSRQLQQQAESGKMQTHGMRCYGYARDSSIVEDEAANIRDAAQRVLRGESLRSIAVDWGRRGIKTTLGNAWSPRGVKRILLNPRIAGERVHRGQVVAKGDWEPIIDPSEQAKVKAVLTDPSRLTTLHNVGGKTPVRVHLLSGGLLRCGLCGSKMVPQTSGSKKPGYACRPGPPVGGCGRIRIAAPDLEANVAERVLARLASPAVRQRLAAAASQTTESGELLTDQIAELEKRLTELSEDRVEGLITREQMLAGTARVKERLDELRSAVARAAQVQSLPEAITPESLADWWENDATIERKRDLIMTLLEHIEIHPATRKGMRTFDEDRVVYLWK